MTATLEEIALKIRTGSHDAAKADLDSLRATDENRNEVTFLRGYLQELAFNREGALETYEELLARDPDHTEAAFRAAILCDLAGEDEAAIEHYETCTSKPPAHVNALMNLALLYEENGRLEDAEAIIDSIVDEHPNLMRARQLKKSVDSSTTMVMDERIQRDREKHDAVLDTPVSDFELSVRSRNCLKQMNIRTLGDLLRTTEMELLSYKNFGETSLNEIKAMLTQRGLRLGQELEPAAVAPTVPAPVVRSAAGDGAIHLKKLVSEMELSVRSRKCLQRLGVTTIEELVAHTEAELLSTKNFGQTSLNEIKRQLAILGLSLRLTT